MTKTDYRIRQVYQAGILVAVMVIGTVVVYRVAPVIQVRMLYYFIRQEGKDRVVVAHECS
ncbi:hypothetical protein D9M68_715940 [compost metagenome]